MRFRYSYVCIILHSSVYVKFPESSTATSIKLVIRGQELSEFDYQYVLQQDEENFQTKISQRTARKDILKTELKLAESLGKFFFWEFSADCQLVFISTKLSSITQAGFPEGCFVYPFQYQLPHGLPGQLI